MAKVNEIATEPQAEVCWAPVTADGRFLLTGYYGDLEGETPPDPEGTIVRWVRVRITPLAPKRRKAKR